jgi:hypothetical protein
VALSAGVCDDSWGYGAVSGLLAVENTIVSKVREVSRALVSWFAGGPAGSDEVILQCCVSGRIPRRGLRFVVGNNMSAKTRYIENEYFCPEPFRPRQSLDGDCHPAFS